MFMLNDMAQEVKGNLTKEELQALASMLAHQSLKAEKHVQIDMQALQSRFLSRMEAAKSAGTLKAYRYDLQAFHLPAAIPTVDDFLCLQHCATHIHKNGEAKFILCLCFTGCTNI